MINIYSIKFDDTIIYVGQTKFPIKKRWWDHRSLAKTAKRKGKLQRKIFKYGHERFSIHLIETVDVEIADDREIYWIKELDTINNGCNITSGGQGNRGCKMSEQQKQFLSELKKNEYINGGGFSQWNGSEEQKAMLRVKMKERDNTWGDKVSMSRSGIYYRILMDDKDYFTYNLNKFSKENGLSQVSLWLSFNENRPVKTKGHAVQVFRAETPP